MQGIPELDVTLDYCAQ